VGVLYADSTGSKLFAPERMAGKSRDEVFGSFEAKVNQFSEERGLTEGLFDLEKARTSVEQFEPYGRT